MNRFFLTFLCLLLTIQVLFAQIKDTLLLQEVLHTITTNKEVAPFASCIEVNDFTNTEYGKERVHLFVENEAYRSKSAHYMLFINRKNENLSPTFKALGMKGVGVLSIKNCEIYYVYRSTQCRSNAPILLDIDSIYVTDIACEFYFSTITPTWRKTAFKLANPPSHLYQFHLSFKKDENIWKLNFVKKKALQHFAQ